MKIILLGGNASARKLAEDLLREGFDVTFSVASPQGLTTVPSGAKALVGRRNVPLWVETLKGHRFDVAIDGAHPFAVEARKQFREAAEEVDLPFLSLKRPSLIPLGAHRAADAEKAAATAVALTQEGDLVFLAVGVKLLDTLVPFFRRENRRIRARILPTQESLEKALAAGLDGREIIALWGAPGRELERTLLAESGAACLLCKDSGREGGMEAKAEATEALSIPLVVVGRQEEDPEALDERELLGKLQQWKAETLKGRRQEREEQS